MNCQHLQHQVTAGYPDYPRHLDRIGPIRNYDRVVCVDCYMELFDGQWEHTPESVGKTRLDAIVKHFEQMSV